MKHTYSYQAVPALEDARALARSGEAIRLNWNRGSRRIVRDAQDRIALERPRVLRPDR